MGVCHTGVAAAPVPEFVCNSAWGPSRCPTRGETGLAAGPNQGGFTESLKSRFKSQEGLAFPPQPHHRHPGDVGKPLAGC